MEKWEMPCCGKVFFSTTHCGEFRVFSQADFGNKKGKVIHREVFQIPQGVWRNQSDELILAVMSRTVFMVV